MKLNWNFKMWGAIGIVVCILLASGAFFSTQEQDKQSVSILARVNDEGSGIFARSDGPDLDIESSDGWNKRTFMTPGPSSIQHMILNNIVTIDLGMKFVQRGMPGGDNVVYWTQVAPGQMTTQMKTDRDIDGGIAWEPHYSAALEYIDSGSKMCKHVATTDEYLPNHPCCVLAVNNSYLNSNEDVVKRFLAGYVTSVQWINDALDQGVGSDDYEYLIVQTAKIGMPNSQTDAEISTSKNIAKMALSNIKYTYYPNNPYEPEEEFKLTKQLEDVINMYKELKIVQEETLTNAGFDTALDFTEHLIQDHYLTDVIKDGMPKTPEEMGYTGGMSSINVAYLAADVHQMALHIGKSKGFYEEYGIHVDLKGPYAAGGDVMNALMSKHANLGFVGSPPVVLSSINALRG